MVFVGSKNALVASAGASAYCAAKAAALHLARCIAIEGAEHGIRANVVNPDAVIRGSRIWDGRWRAERAASYGIDPAQVEEFYRTRSLLKRSVYPEDVAEAVYLLRVRPVWQIDRQHPERGRWQRHRVPTLTKTASCRQPGRPNSNNVLLTSLRSRRSVRHIWWGNRILVNQASSAPFSITSSCVMVDRERGVARRTSRPCRRAVSLSPTLIFTVVGTRMPMGTGISISKGNPPLSSSLGWPMPRRQCHFC